MKKVVLSVLSTALVTSMATSAFAASTGYYLGGNIDKYYGADALINADVASTFKNEVFKSSLTQSQVLFVNTQGKVASLQDLVDAIDNGQTSKEAFRVATGADFDKIGGEEGFHTVLEDGTVDTEKKKVSEQDGQPAGDLKVESVSAITKTKVEVKFNKAVDSIKSENFAIAGASVNAATLSEDKKTVTLTVSGLNYDAEYAVVAKDVLVDGKPVTLTENKFKTPAVTDVYNLELTTNAAGDQILANGSDNLVITAKLLDKVTGQVDVNADNVVVAFSTTYGNLANTRVTVQNGVASVTLTSEFSQKDLVAKIDAQVIEASGDYKELIGKVVGNKNVHFKVSLDPTPGVDDKPVVVSAGSNQADRVTVNFNRDVTVADFVQYDETTKLFKVSGGIAVLKDGTSINVSQDGVSKKVVGLKPVSGNSKAVEVILDKEEYLDDNKSVKVEFVQQTNVGPQTTKADFILTDARKPEATSAVSQDLKTVVVKFSESIAKAEVSLDGGITEVEFKDFGVFNPATLEDKRDMLTIKTKNYLTSGTHSVQLSSIHDFAGLTDNKNISTSQTLDFDVQADIAVPVATVGVESPEQFRVTFNKIVEGLTADKVKLQVAVKNADGTESWVNVADTTDKYKVTPVLDMDNTPENKNEYVFELTEDWTKIYDTEGTKLNYYNDKYRLFIPANSVTNPANGKQNADIQMLLNDTIMTTPDTTSPTIKEISKIEKDRFNVEMSKPVKLPGKDGGHDTASQSQPSGIPTPIVEFLGKDKAGNHVTIKGTFKDYTDKNKADKQFEVTLADGQQSPQAIVNDGGDKNWTLVVRSISDDVGNTAATLTKNFVIEPDSVVVDDIFMVKGDRGGSAYNGVDAALNGTDPDTITLTFTSGVQYTGSVKNAVNPANYLLDGENLPKGSILKVASDNNIQNGYEIVIISLPDGTLSTSEKSNVITLSKSLESYKGTKLTGEYTVTFKPGLGVDPETTKKEAEVVDNTITSLPALADLKVTDEDAVKAARSAYDALSKEAKVLVKNLKTLNDAEAKIADLKKADGDATILETAKAAVNVLETAIGKDLAVEANLVAAEAALKDAEEKVAKVTAGSDKDYLAAKVTVAKKTVTDARAKFDGDAATALNNAQEAVKVLEDAAKEDLTVEEKLTAAEKAVADADTAVAKVAAGDDKKALEVKVAAAKKTVEDARTAFDKAVADAAELKVAKDDLEKAIKAAKDQNDAAVAGTDTGEYPQVAKEAYNTEIQKAEAVFNKAGSDKKELEDAKKALDSAKTTFEGTVNP